MSEYNIGRHLIRYHSGKLIHAPYPGAPFTFFLEYLESFTLSKQNKEFRTANEKDQISDKKGAEDVKARTDALEAQCSSPPLKSTEAPLFGDQDALPDNRCPTTLAMNGHFFGDLIGEANNSGTCYRMNQFFCYMFNPYLDAVISTH